MAQVYHDVGDAQPFTTTKENWKHQAHLIFLPCYSAEISEVVPCLHSDWNASPIWWIQLQLQYLEQTVQVPKEFFAQNFSYSHLEPNNSSTDVTKSNVLFNTLLHDPLAPQHHLIFFSVLLMHIPEKLPSLLSPLHRLGFEA